MTNKLATLRQLTLTYIHVQPSTYTHTHTIIAFLCDERIKTREFFN